MEQTWTCIWKLWTVHLAWRGFECGGVRRDGGGEGDGG
jgi:hypothetical protein